VYDQAEEIQRVVDEGRLEEDLPELMENDDGVDNGEDDEVLQDPESEDDEDPRPAVILRKTRAWEKRKGMTRRSFEIRCRAG